MFQQEKKIYFLFSKRTNTKIAQKQSRCKMKPFRVVLLWRLVFSGAGVWEQHIQQDELWADKITGFVIHTEQWSGAEKNRRLHSSGRYFPSTLTSNVTCVSWPLMWGSVVVLRAEITFLLWLLKETKAKKKRNVMKNAADTVDLSYLCVCGLWGMVRIEMFLSLTEQTCFFFLPFLCVSASQINVTLHYNRSCRDYFSADRKPVRKRACRWQAFAFLCLLRKVQWNARLCAFSEMQQSVSGVNTKGKTRVFFPGKDGSGLFISRALLHVHRALLPANRHRTLLQLHSGLPQLIFHIQGLLFFVFASHVRSPVQPVRGRKDSKHQVFHLTQANFFKWKCVVI